MLLVEVLRDLMWIVWSKEWYLEVLMGGACMVAVEVEIKVVVVLCKEGKVCGSWRFEKMLC